MTDDQPILTSRLYTEIYDLSNYFTLNYFRRTIDNPFERINFRGPIGFGGRKILLYLSLGRDSGEETEITQTNIDLPQDITSMLSSDVFSSEVQEMLRESGLVEDTQPTLFHHPV